MCFVEIDKDSAIGHAPSIYFETRSSLEAYAPSFDGSMFSISIVCLYTTRTELLLLHYCCKSWLCCTFRPIYPCRSLCTKVRQGCEGRMKAYGFPWPAMLDCDKFPEDNDMCIAAQSPGTQRDGEYSLPQSWALSVFFNFFNNKK